MRARFDSDELRVFIIFYIERRTNTCIIMMIIIYYYYFRVLRVFVRVCAFSPSSRFHFYADDKTTKAESDNIIYVAGHI